MLSYDPVAKNYGWQELLTIYVYECWHPKLCDKHILLCYARHKTSIFSQSVSKMPEMVAIGNDAESQKFIPFRDARFPNPTVVVDHRSTDTDTAPVLDPAARPRLPHLHGHGGAVADLLQLLLKLPRLAPDSCRGQAFVTVCIFKEDSKERKGKQASQVSFKIKANLSLLCRGLPVQYLVKHQITCTVYLIFNFRRYLLGYILRLIHCP